MTEKTVGPVKEVRRRFTYVKKETIAQLSCDILWGRFPHRWTPEFDEWRVGFWRFFNSRFLPESAPYNGNFDRWLHDHPNEWDQVIADYNALHPAPPDKS